VKPVLAPNRPNTPAASVAAQQPARDLQISRGINVQAQKIILYGPGGVGKSSLAASLKDSGIDPLFIDFDEGSNFLDVARVVPQTLDETRRILQNREMFQPFGAIVLDSLTKAEEVATAWTLANVPHEKGHAVKSVEGYGFGKGYQHVFETMLMLLGDLDAVARSGKHVVCIAHECVANVPNPQGEDFIRYEPRLQSPASGKSSVRLRVKEWADHLIFIGYDQVIKDGKATGAGTRTIYTTERPTHMAKSRSLDEAFPYQLNDLTLWNKLFNKE
jgi:hypothetical protein